MRLWKCTESRRKGICWMAKKNELFLWSDGWCIEDDKAWFVSGIENFLFCVDLQKKECEYAAQIPEKAGRFRVTPRCIKCGSDIFCVPDKGRSIWVYNINFGIFTEIRISNPNNVRLELDRIWEFENQIFAVSYGLRQIIIIDIVQKKITDYYEIETKGIITYSVKIADEIYILDRDGKICQVDMKTGKQVSYRLPDTGRKFYSFGFDGKKLWLTGYCKELCVWDKEQNTVSFIDVLTKEIDIENSKKGVDNKIGCVVDEYPVFSHVITAEESIWFIPTQTKEIIYVNKNEQVAHLFEVEETENPESIKSKGGEKYILEYIIGNRYIGLFSLENERILQIDTKKLQYKWCDYYFSDNCVRKLVELYGNKFREGDIFQCRVYNMMLQLNRYHEGHTKKENIGGEIYRETMCGME